MKNTSHIELLTLLNENLVKGSIIGSQTIKGNMTETRTVMVTPELAKELLKRNTNNRPLSNGNLNKIYTAMIKGEWNFDGKPIIFDEDGNLLDGQTRLSGVVKSGKSIEFNIGTGYKSEIFATMDIGKTRTGSDVLAIEGYKHYGLVNLTANFYYKYTLGLMGGTTTRAVTPLSHPELLKFVKVKPEIIESVDFYTKVKRIQTSSLIENYMVSGLHLIFSERDPHDADYFLRHLLTGENLDRNSPIFQLRNRLLNSKTDKTKRLISNETIRLTFSAWNKFRKGEKVKYLKIPESLPEII